MSTSLVTDLRVRYGHDSEKKSGIIRAVFMDGDRPGLWVQNARTGELDFIWSTDSVYIYQE